MSSVEATIARGVTVVIKAYQPVEISGARILVRPRGNESINTLPAALLGLNVDGAQHLLALLRQEDDSVFQAVWTSSPVVAYILYTGLVNEISLTAVMAELSGRATLKSIRESFDDLRQFHPISSQGPVYQRLLGHLNAEVPGGSGKQNAGRTTGKQSRKKKTKTA